MKERPESDEHVFPLAIGGSLVIKRVCESCNSELGTTADAPLSNHLFAVFQRSELKLPGNAGKVPDVARTLFANGVLADDQGQRIRLEPGVDGKSEPRIVYKASDVTLPNGQAARSITLDASTSKQEVRKVIGRERKRAGLPPINEVEFELTMREITSSIQTQKNPEVIYRLAIDTVNFKRGLLKIAYELAWLWLGESYLDDPMGATLRMILRKEIDEEESGLRGDAQLGAGFSCLSPWSSDKTSHIAFNMTTEGRVTICVRVFQSLSAIVGVSEHPEMHGVYPGAVEQNNFVAIDPISRIIRQTSLIDEFGRLMSLR